MNVRKSNVFARFPKKDAVTICRVSDLLEDHYFSANDLADKFVELSQQVWGTISGGKFVWTKEMIMSHFKICPRFIFCAFCKGKVIATLTNMLIDQSSLNNHSSWLDKTGNGCLTTHKPKSRVGFGADLSVLKNAPKSASNKLVLAALVDGVIGEGLQAVYLGSRIPFYHKNSHMDVRNYVYGKRKNGKPFDPELYFYLKNGFEIVGIIPDYMEDPESLNYGVLIRWKNPFYWVTRMLPFLKPIIRFIGKKLFLRIPQIK